MFPRLCGITHRETFLLDVSSCMWVVSTNDTFTSVPYGQPYCTRGDWEQPRHSTETAGGGKGTPPPPFGEKEQTSPQPAPSTAEPLSARSGEIAACPQLLPSQPPSDDRRGRETGFSSAH